MTASRCTIESILSGCITTWYGNCTAHNCRVVYRWQTTCPPGHLQNQMSQKAKKIIKDNSQELLPVHPAAIQKARSVQVDRSWDRETEKQLLFQGHQTVCHH